MTYFFITLIIIFSLWFFFEPIFSFSKIKVPEESGISENLNELQKKKIILLKEIKDLEMEYKSGRLNENEYIAIRNYLEKEVYEINKKIETLKKPL